MTEAMLVSMEEMDLYEQIYKLRVREKAVEYGLIRFQEDSKNDKVTGEQSGRQQPGE
jgi:hypothetical protein